MSDRIGDPLRLTRRDRAALTLALECLRAKVGPFGDHAYYHVNNAAGALDLGRAVSDQLRDVILDMERDDAADWRLLRARIALALRAILRADAIERDDWWPRYEMRTRVVCAGCGDILPAYAHGEKTSAACPRTGRVETARNAIPLWEQAPATRER